MVGIGICIRDENGTFVLARTECFGPLCEVHVGETLGLLSTLDCSIYENFHVEFLRKQVNEVAHSLANATLL